MLLDSLERSNLGDQRSVLLVQILDRVVELSGLLYSNLFLAVGVWRTAGEGVGSVVIYSSLGCSQLLLKVDGYRYSSSTFVLNRDRLKGVKQRMTNYGYRAL